MICVQSVIRLKKKTNFKGTFPFRGCVEGGGEVVLELRRPWEGEGDNFCLVNTCKAGGGLLVTAFQHGLFLAEPLAQHILIIILILTHF